MLGLFAFFYGVVHLSCYVTFDKVFDIERDRQGHRQAALHHRRLRGAGADDAARGHLHQGLDPPLGGMNWNRLHMADLPDRHPRRAALLVAGEARHHLAAGLRRDPGGAARLPRLAEAAPARGAPGGAQRRGLTRPRSRAGAAPPRSRHKAARWQGFVHAKALCCGEPPSSGCSPCACRSSLLSSSSRRRSWPLQRSPRTPAREKPAKAAAPEPGRAGGERLPS